MINSFSSLSAINNQVLSQRKPRALNLSLYSDQRNSPPHRVRLADAYGGTGLFPLRLVKHWLTITGRHKLLRALQDEVLRHILPPLRLPVILNYKKAISSAAELNQAAKKQKSGLKDFKQQDPHDLTLLVYNYHLNQDKKLEYLAKMLRCSKDGYDVNKVNPNLENQTPVHLAASLPGCSPMLELLVALGGNVHLKSDTGTALHEMASQTRSLSLEEQRKIVELLRAEKLNPHVKNVEGKLAIDYLDDALREEGVSNLNVDRDGKMTLNRADAKKESIRKLATLRNAMAEWMRKTPPPSGE